jgi:hypothetical protein
MHDSHRCQIAANAKSSSFTPTTVHAVVERDALWHRDIMSLALVIQTLQQRASRKVMWLFACVHMRMPKQYLQITRGAPSTAVNC